jgi:isopropylmalate/homocitrate/citramalate synthase
MEKPWIKEKWYVSNYNFHPDVKKEIKLSNIEISDCTLREGEQQPGVVLTGEEKVRIAKALDELGIHQIEAGMPAVSPEEQKTITHIAKAGLRAKILAFCRARKEEIQIARDCGVWGILCSLPSSTLLIEEKLKWPYEKVIETAIELTNFAHDQGLYVVFSPFDTTRADFQFLSRYIQTVIAQGHVDRLRLVDTRGCISSQGIAFLIRKIRELTNLPIEIHCHDDFGLATANTIIAAVSGANVLSTTINGMGERSGNASTEEVAVALLLLYGVDLKLKYEKFYGVSRLVQELTGVKLQPHKAVVGQNAFSFESGAGLEGFAKGNPFISETYLPEVVGQKFSVLLGKKSGKYSIQMKLEELSLTVPDEKVATLLKEVKEQSERTKKPVSDEAFREMVRRVIAS